MLQKLQFKSGINRENTNYATESGWWSMDKVRFRSGQPEKIGGWTALGSETFRGVARSLTPYSTLTGDTLIGVGTHLRYYVNYGQQYHNITPLRRTQVRVDPFTVYASSNVVMVTDTAHGATAGDIVLISGATDVGGITGTTLNDAEGYQVDNVIDADNYTIIVPGAASSSATGGGTVTLTYEIPAGLPVYSIGTGWSAGIWNAPITSVSTYLTDGTQLALNNTDVTINVNSTAAFPASGTLLIENEIITYSGKTGTSFTGCARGTNGSMAANHARRQTGPGTYAALNVYLVLGFAGDNGWGDAVDSSFGIGLQLRLWSAAPYGEDLVMAPRGGGIYYWTKDTSTFVRADPLRDAGDPALKFVPHTVNAVVVSDIERFVIALGANPYDPLDEDTAFDPMLIRWSHQDDVANWIPAATNQAGEQRVSTGSYLMTAVRMKQEQLVWSDAALYSMQYVGPPYVWRIELSASNISLAGPNAVAVANNTAFWMGVDKFYIYNGRVETLPCTLRHYVFEDMSFDQRFQTCCGTSEGFNEVWWFYVSNDEVTNASAASRAPTVDKYVVFNYAEQVWYYGTLNRTAWIDSPLLDGPLAATGTTEQGSMVVHEQGVDDVTVNGTGAIDAYIQSSDFDIADGQQFMFIWRMLPDVSFDGSQVQNPSVVMSLIPRQSSGAPYGTADTGTVASTQDYRNARQYSIQQFTEQLFTRVRARQMALRIESTGTGIGWQLGTPRIDVRPDGRKS